MVRPSADPLRSFSSFDRERDQALDKLRDLQRQTAADLWLADLAAFTTELDKDPAFAVNRLATPLEK
jgi:hypothetical protein